MSARASVPPLFVVGCPRSGTTLLAELLGFSRWSAPVETHFITKYARRLDTYGPLSDRRSRLELLRAILDERPVMQWKLGVEPEELLKKVEAPEYAAIVDAVCGARAEREGKQGWADKTPHYILDLSLLVELFPGARFIHVFRDGRDVALSLLERPWGPGNVYSCATYWKRCVQRSELQDRLTVEGRFLEVRYENLLDDPSPTIRELFRFLDEPVPETAGTWIGGLQRGNHGKWRARMRPGDIRLFEHVAGDELSRLGYSTEHQVMKVSMPRRAYYSTHAFVHWARFMLQQNLVDAIRIRYFGKEPFAE